jgi:hypothetical protein
VRSTSRRTDPVPTGTRYRVPADVLGALERVFAQPNLDRIAVIYRPLYVRSHLFFIGARYGSVTRPERIYTNIAQDVFFDLDRHVLHEYYHVVQQWGRERMTRAGYLLTSRRREHEARRFTALNAERYRLYRRELSELQRS